MFESIAWAKCFAAEDQREGEKVFLRRENQISKGV